MVRLLVCSAVQLTQGSACTLGLFYAHKYKPAPRVEIGRAVKGLNDAVLRHSRLADANYSNISLGSAPSIQNTAPVTFASSPASSQRSGPMFQPE